MSSIPKVSCSQCRSDIPNLLDKPILSGCLKCGSVAAMRTEGVWREQKRYAKLSKNFQEPFLLGSEIQYQDKIFEVFAIYNYKVDFQEWDSEDSKWVHCTGYITEWYAKNGLNHYFTLMSDTDGSMFIVHRSADNQLTDWQIQNNVIEYGSFELLAMGGTDDEPLEHFGYYRYFKNGLLIESAQQSFI